MFTTSTSGWWGKPVMTLHVQVVPPHDHDALLNRILHFWNINMKLRMPRCRWSTSPAAARSAISTRCTPGTIITTTISQKRVRTSLTRAVYPHPAAVQRNERQQEVFQRHGIDALTGKITTLITLTITHSSQFSTYLRVIKIIATTDSTVIQESQNGKASGCSSGIVTCKTERLHQADRDPRQESKERVDKRVSKPIATTQAASQPSALLRGSQRICSSASWLLLCRDHAYQP